MAEPHLLWDLICSRLQPCELAEAESIVGPDLVERNKDVASEIGSLCSMREDIQEVPKILYDTEKISFYLE